jgi:bifunctional non-homologous end joining protein LigD
MATKTSDAAELAGVRLTHPDKVLFPEQGITKRALGEYYEAVAERMLPHARRRPLSLVRCPAGSEKHCFFQRHAGSGVPASIARVEIPNPAEGTAEDTIYLYVEDLAGLLGLVQIGVIELHVWGSTVDRPDRPDRLIFDLDPAPGLPWSRVVTAATAVRQDLERLGLQSFVKTTGGKGLHVVVPIAPTLDWEAARRFAHGFAEALADEAPTHYTTNARKDDREGKIFVDYLRNGWSASAVAPYSPRARKGATVATPIEWAELADGIRPADFTIETVPKRLAAQKKDPWADLGRIEQTIDGATLRAVRA